jgi:UDP-N-acetylmuramate--alanine ligase
MKKGLNPTYYFGSPYLANKDQAEWTDGKVFIIETDEHDHSFLNFDVDIAIVGNIDKDHMENFNFDIKNLVADMEKFAQQSLDRGGWQIFNADDKNVLSINLTHFKNVITFGRSEHAHMRAGQTRFFRDGYNLCTETEVFWKGESIGMMKMQVPGEHNVINALASVAALSKAGINPKDALPELADFPGTQRRIELMGVSNNHPLYDDYSHHPTAMIKGLETLRSYYPGTPICLVLQPMRYSRVYYLPKEYSEAVRYADRVILTEINPSGEDNLWNSDINVLAKTIKDANPSLDFTLVPHIEDVPAEVKRGIKKDEIIYFSGPSTVRALSKPILDLLK